MRFPGLPARRGPGAGFTMLELIVVLFIMAVMAGMAIPSFVRAMPGQRMLAEIRGLFASARYARSQAVVKGIRHRLVLDPSLGEYWLEWESDPFQSAGIYAAAEGSWGKRHRMDETIFLRDMEASGAETVDGGFYAVVFNPDGTAAADAVLALGAEADSEEAVGLFVRSLTGVSRIVEGEDLAEAWSDVAEEALK